MRSILLPVIAATLLATAATAQVYPSQSETPVTDDAELLTPVQEAELASRITALEQDTGSDIAVVTLPGTQFYTMGEDLEVYATALKAEWAMGAATEGRSVLLLVFRDDRELHLAAGPGFTPEQVAQTQGIVTDVILPEFRADNYPAGITAGVEAIATRILAPAEAAPTEAAPAEATPASAPVDTTAPAEGGSSVLLWIGGGGVALIGLIVGANRRAKAKLAATPCPACGKTGLTRERVTLREATDIAEGRGEIRTTCPSCGHTTAEPLSTPKLEAAKPAAKKSAGGGSSGEW